MTIEQLEAFSETKPELRYLTEEIIKYLQANPGGGSGDVESVVAGTGISVDDTDPANPIVSATGGGGYLVHTVNLTQTGGATAPVVTVLENTIGEVVWTRNGSGYYRATLPGAFTLNKTALLIGTPGVEEILIQHLFESVNVTSLTTFVSNGDGTFSAADGCLLNTTVEIRVYP